MIYGYCKRRPRSEEVSFWTDRGEERHVSADAAARGILACEHINKRTWIVLRPCCFVPGGEDVVTPPGEYPIYRLVECVPRIFDEALSKEINSLRDRYEWDLYHDHEGRGQWGAKKKLGTKTRVTTMYGLAQTGSASLPTQNPCGLTGEAEWSSKDVCQPFIAMPPVTRRLRDFLHEGNPSVTSLFAGIVDMSEMYLGCAAYMDYTHETDMGDALSWHYDKSLGVETFCISVTPSGGDECDEAEEENEDGTQPRLGHKTIGFGGYPSHSKDGACPKNVGAYRTMPIPTRSFWGCNAKAVYHAVGNDTKRSTTIVFRTQMPRSMYRDHFLVRGARELSIALRDVQLRYFPVLSKSDIPT